MLYLSLLIRESKLAAFIFCVLAFVSVSLFAYLQLFLPDGVTVWSVWDFVIVFDYFFPKSKYILIITESYNHTSTNLSFIP